MVNQNTMKKLKKYGYSALVLLLTCFSFTSCNDEWDAHYSVKDTGKIDSNLIDYIKSRSDLRIFLGMIQFTGYDSILSQTKAYTIWAPTDTSLINNLVLLDTASWKNLVTNHIATYAHPVSQADSMTITMLNGKRLVFNNKMDYATMDGVPLIEKDIATNNGLLQVMSNIVPYRYNQWENIEYKEGLDSLRAYVRSLNKRVLDYNLSYDNNVFIDSVFTNSNDILTSLGDLDLEDSIYTSILPDNAAWIDAYNRISPYFKMNTVDGGALAQRANTLWTLVHDLFFWGRIDTPIAGGALFSTSYNKFTNADSLFMNSEKLILSNGYGYKTSKLNHKPSESWCKEIRVEAENAYGGRFSTNYEITTLSSLGTKFNVSKNAYISCRPTSTSALSPLTLVFPIPNTLSTKYNIYAVFVPTVITDTIDKRPFKVECSISSNVNLATYSSGPQPTYTKLAVTNYITDPLNMTKMLIAKDYVFPNANLTSGIWKSRSVTPTNLTSGVNIGIRIKNLATTSAADTKAYNRYLRIDCIILEPVQ